MICEQHRTDILQSAVDTFGALPQMGMMIEECAELIQAMQKLNRKDIEATRDHVCEEIADVQIMLDQMKIIFGDSPVEKWEQFKLARLQDRISDSHKQEDTNV